MADLTGLTDDELADGFADHFSEVEARLAAGGHTAALRDTHIAHAHMNKVRGKLVDASVIQPDSAGGPKP